MQSRTGTRLIFCFIALIWNLKCQAVSVEKDITLSQQEKIALDEFRVIMQRHLVQDFMKKDIYLIKWLRAKNLDVQAAKQMLLNNIQWRQDNKMDSIIEEDFSRFDLEFPISQDGTDYTGRPVMSFDVSDWDVRRMVISGQRDMITRHIFRSIEIARRRVEEAQKRGELVTQWITLADFKGFNLIQHGCGQCINVYINLIMAGENYYPEMLHKFIVVNAPPSFQVVLRLLLPVMSKSSQEAFSAYGNNRQEWEPVILNMISPNEIGREFGGNRIE